MKRIFFFTLILICIFVLPIYAQYPALKKYPNYIKTDTVVTADITPPLPAGSFIATIIDTSGINIKASGFAELDTFMIRYSTVDYPSLRSEGTLIIANTDSALINNDNFTLNLTSNVIYYLTMWVGDSLNNFVFSNRDTCRFYYDITPPIAASSFVLTSPDSGHCTIISSGVPADMDSFRINFTTSTYPATRTTGTLLLAGNLASQFNNDNIAVDLIGNTQYYGCLWLADATGNWILFANANKDTFMTQPDITPPITASTFTLTASDSTGVTVTSSGIPADADSFRITFQASSYPGSRTTGVLLIGSKSFATINNDLIAVDLINSTTYYGRLWLRDNQNNWILAASANSDTFTTPAPNFDPPIPALEFTLSASDTTHVTVVSSGIPANADSFRINFSLSDYPASRTAGTLLIGGKNFSTINNDIIAANLTDGEIYYGKFWTRTVWDSWIAYANANSDTFKVADVTPPAQVSSITATENDTDSVNVVINYGSAEHDSIRAQWSHATITSRTNGTNFYAGHVATTTLRFKHNVTAYDTLYIKIYLADKHGVWNTGTQTSLNILDHWPPLAGTLDYDIFVPDYDDSSYVTNSVSTDLALFEMAAGTRDAASKQIYQSNLYTVDVPQDTLLNLSGKVSYVGNDTIFLFAYWWDTFDNHSPVAYDSIFPTPTQYLVNFIIDTSHAVLDSLIFGIGSTANPGEMNWDMRIGINDTLAGSFGDTLKVDIPDTLITQYEIAHVRSLIRFTTGLSEDTSDAVQYPGIYTGGTITFYGRTKN